MPAILAFPELVDPLPPPLDDSFETDGVFAGIPFPMPSNQTGVHSYEDRLQIIF